jgi:hypothetical protein
MLIASFRPHARSQIKAKRNPLTQKAARAGADPWLAPFAAMR